MKKNYQYTLAILAIVVLSFGFYSCNSDESILLEVSTNELMYEEFGGKLTFEVTTDYEGELKVETNADWLTVSPVVGTGKWEL